MFRLLMGKQINLFKLDQAGEARVAAMSTLVVIREIRVVPFALPGLFSARQLFRRPDHRLDFFGERRSPACNQRRQTIQKASQTIFRDIFELP